MKVSDFLECYENLPTFPGIKANSTIFKWYDTQSSCIGIRSLGFSHGCPNSEADELGLHKDGRSRRGVAPGYRPVAAHNAKRRGIKSPPKSQKRLSMKF